MKGRATSRRFPPLGASDPSSHSRMPTREPARAARSKPPHSTSSEASRYVVETGSPVTRARSARDNSGVSGPKASSNATTLLITDRPCHSVLPPATRSSCPPSRAASPRPGGHSHSAGNPWQRASAFRGRWFTRRGRRRSTRAGADHRPRRRAAAMGEPIVEETATGAPVVIEGLEGLRERVDSEVGVSGWRTVTQEDITTFATLTGDEQWIHVDPERAKTGPFGATVQHGFLTLGLATGLLWEVCTVEGFGVVLNYGLNKVRFPAPLRVGSRIRMRVQIADVKEIDGPGGTGAEAVYRLTYDVEGQDKPCCVADLVFRYYP